jgi:hypothetical protein
MPLITVVGARGK